MPFRFRSVFSLFIFAAVVGPAIAFAQTSTITVNAQSLIPKATISISPAGQTILEGSTFDVSIYLDSQQNSVNTLDLTIDFPPDKLAIVSPSGGTSLIQLWLQPPTYSNTEGTIQFTGVIPDGIVTQNGLVATMTFKALAPGEADITFSPESSVLANDGLGTQMNAEFGRGTYTVVPQPPSGPVVFSPTHPFESDWYNNNSPVFEWQPDPNAGAWSYVLDNNPNTIPDDTLETTSTSESYQNLGDGLWYFHIKEEKFGEWGATTNFLAQIDTQPPAAFTPSADIIQGSDQNGGQKKILISFFTTDALSGIDHYEVAVINSEESSTVSPVFIQTQSPYQLAVPGPGTYHVIVRAVDGAGNIRDESIDVTISTPFIQFLKNNETNIIIGLLLLILLLFILHYFFGHKLLRRAQKAIIAAEQEDRREQVEEAKQLIGKEDLPPAAMHPESETNEHQA